MPFVVAKVSLFGVINPTAEQGDGGLRANTVPGVFDVTNNCRSLINESVKKPRSPKRAGGFFGLS